MAGTPKPTHAMAELLSLDLPASDHAAILAAQATHCEECLGAGGWFGESHDSEALKAATTPDEEARLTAVRTLLAEEARMGMMVGVAVGWALADQLEQQESEPTKED